MRQADEGQFAGHLYEFDRHKGEQVLDVGCGIGWLVWQFAHGGAKVTGVDLSDNSLALARKRLDYDGLQAELVKGNAQELPFPDASFDFVTSAGVLHHTPDTQGAIDEIHRVLRPGGRAMISLYYRNWALSRWMWPLTRTAVHLAYGRVPGRSQFALGEERGGFRPAFRRQRQSDREDIHDARVQGAVSPLSRSNTRKFTTFRNGFCR